MDPIKHDVTELIDVNDFIAPVRPRFARGGGDQVSVILAPAEIITDPDRAEQLGLTADARRMRREQCD